MVLDFGRSRSRLAWPAQGWIGLDSELTVLQVAPKLNARDVASFFLCSRSHHEDDLLVVKRFRLGLLALTSFEK
jgi:hypothetical protein